jgi:hypothetical protein
MFPRKSSFRGGPGLHRADDKLGRDSQKPSTLRIFPRLIAPISARGKDVSVPAPQGANQPKAQRLIRCPVWYNGDPEQAGL